MPKKTKQVPVKVLKSKTYKSKSSSELFRDIRSKGLLKGYFIQHPKVKRSTLEKNPDKYVKSLKTYAKKQGVRVTKSHNVNPSGLTGESLGFKKGEQLFIRYRNGKEVHVISQLILDDSKEYFERRLKVLKKIIAKYEGNVIEKIYTTNLDEAEKIMLYNKKIRESEKKKLKKKNK